MLKYPNKVVLAFEIAAYIIQNRVQVFEKYASRQTGLNSQSITENIQSSRQ